MKAQKRWQDVNAAIVQQRIAAWRAYYAVMRALRELTKAYDKAEFLEDEE